MSEAAMEMVARRFKVLGEPMRLRLLHALESGEQSVSALMDATGATQANVSKHLSLLMSAGLVDRRREGMHVYYFISDPMVFQLCELVCSGIKKHLQTTAEHL